MIDTTTCATCANPTGRRDADGTPRCGDCTRESTTAAELDAHRAFEARAAASTGHDPTLIDNVHASRPAEPVRRTYTVPAAFYADHVERGCGESDRVVKTTSRTVTVELDAAGYIDLRSDADYYANPATSRDMAECGGFGAYGLARSAAATLRRLDADPFTEAELVAGHAELQRRADELAEQSRAMAAERAERQAAERAARETEAEAHPQVRADYGSKANDAGVPTVLGIDAEHGEQLRAGARVSVFAGGLWYRFELVELGRYRHGNVPAAATIDGEPVDLTIELCGRIAPELVEALS